MAPLPVTIGVPPETTRSSWSLIKIVAGLISGRGGGGYERRGWLAVEMGLVAPGQVLQHVDLPLAAGRHHRQEPLHEPAPRRAVRPAARLAVDPPVAQRPLGVIVRRLDPLDSHERPEVRLTG